ncbi:MAG TPA: excinuclease ABC subunit UvrC [Nitrospiria bacterium]|nr:excinuclease ABC subunit UvrC [Nitrospiria bacterium]
MTLKNKLEALPHNPGVYLMKGEHEKILYIGKARSLSDRVRSYFHKGATLTPKICSMVDQVQDIEVLVTLTELEALILENNLIKKHRPKYNVLLRDDKNYPFLRLPIKDDYPRLQIVRRVKRDGALYYGPYVPTNALRETLKVLRRVFPLPNCKIKIDGTAERACIEFEIKRCLAPCTGHQSREQYRAMIHQVRMFLEGKDRELIHQLRTQMEAEAQHLNFEEAARLRDTILKVERILEKQRVTTTDLTDQDVISLARQRETVDLQVMFVRGGMLIGRRDFLLEGVADWPEDELYASFIEQFYAKEGIIPPEILLPVKLTEKELLEQWLSDRRGGPVHLHSPSRGPDTQLLKLAQENAALCLQEHLALQEHGEQALIEVQRLLHLRRLPRRVEAFDISNMMGDQAVGSMVVWDEKGMKKSDYRKFRIRTIQGANDFAMLQEVLYRQYSRVKETGGKFPDLILIDGGKGQLSAALEVLERLNLRQKISEGLASPARARGVGASEDQQFVSPDGPPHHIDIIGLAKAREEKEERVFLPGASEAIILPPASPATHLLQRIRDEAHRFAVTYHRKLRGQEMVTSVLDEIDGIGEIRKRALLRHFGSLDGIQRATLEELEKVPELGKVLARRFFNLLSAHSR